MGRGWLDGGRMGLANATVLGVKTLQVGCGKI